MRKHPLLFFVLLLTALFFSSCAYRPAATSSASPADSIADSKSPLDSEVSAPVSTPFPEDEGWSGPPLNASGGYIAPESDGLFYPENLFTRSDAARAVYALMAKKPSGETFLKDVTTKAKCYTAAASLVSNGYFSLDENERFFPDVPIAKEDLSALCKKLFLPSQVEAAFSSLEFPISRGTAAHLFNSLLAHPETQTGPYYPDVSPSHAQYAAIEAAGIDSGNKKYPPGFIHLGGYLYYVNQEGYFLSDGFVGTLYFSPSCRYTSGDDAVDLFVAELVESQTSPSMTREEMLRRLYEYVRDHYLYLKRSIYEVGTTGWENKEALLLFQTGKGNCYNFTAAFWALARGIGYDAIAYAGLVGVERDPHSWVEIPWEDGNTYIFDVETEMSYRLVDDYITSMYKITYETGEIWSYVRTPEE